jgi:hypothetical protein
VGKVDGDPVKEMEELLISQDETSASMAVSIGKLFARKRLMFNLPFILSVKRRSDKSFIAII